MSATSSPYAKPFLALAMASAVMFGMAASSDAREAVSGSNTPRQRAVSDDAIVVAGKVSSALKGAAAGSRLGRSRNSENSEDQADQADGEAGERAQPLEEADGNGPFKVIIPGQSPEEVTIQRTAPRVPTQPRQETTPNAQAAAPADKPAEPSSRVRTLSDIAAGEAPSAANAAPSDGAPTDLATPAGPAAVPAQAASRGEAAPVAAAVPPGATECMAGCYETTSARTQRPPSVRGTSAKGQPAAAQPAPAQPAAARPGIECVAGCDGIDTGNAPPMKRGAASPPSDDETPQRVTVLRGVSRSKAYSTGQ